MVNKKNKTRVKRRISRGSLNVYLLFVIIAVIIGFSLVGNLTVKDALQDSTVVNILPPKQEGLKDNLQLYTFGYTTIAPLPPDDKKPDDGAKKPDDGGKPICSPRLEEQLAKTCNCPAGQKTSALCNEEKDCTKNGGVAMPLQGQMRCLYTSHHPKVAEKQKDPNCAVICVDKPVIYLYPTKPTLVDVSVVSPGRIFVSDPLYPTGGWKNVLAHPDGRLLYEAKEYKELYYETAVSKVNPPKTGIVIATANLDEKLGHIVDQLGLRGEEKKEFMDYWIPRLIKLNSPYILFSILDQDEKERLDHVDIYPKPDTFINFIAYFKAVNTPFYPIDPLILHQAPKRTGFTAVEWGGTIDSGITGM